MSLKINQFNSVLEIYTIQKSCYAHRPFCSVRHKFLRNPICILIFMSTISQTLSTQSKSLPRFLTMGLSVFLQGMGIEPFVPVTAQELVFGYDDPLVSLAHRFFPKTRRPMSQMGLLLGVSIAPILQQAVK